MPSRRSRACWIWAGPTTDDSASSPALVTVRPRPPGGTVRRASCALHGSWGPRRPPAVAAVPRDAQALPRSGTEGHDRSRQIVHTLASADRRDFGLGEEAAHRHPEPGTRTVASWSALPNMNRPRVVDANSKAPARRGSIRAATPSSITLRSSSAAASSRTWNWTVAPTGMGATICSARVAPRRPGSRG